MRDESRLADPWVAFDRQDDILVLGIGNVLWADDGFGAGPMDAVLGWLEDSLRYSELPLS